MIAPLTKYSWLAGPGIWGYLNIRDDLPAVTSSAKTLHLPSAVGPSNQVRGHQGNTGSWFILQSRGELFCSIDVLTIWQSHKNGADEGKFKSGYNCAARGGCAAGCCYKVSLLISDPNWLIALLDWQFKMKEQKLSWARQLNTKLNLYFLAFNQNKLNLFCHQMTTFGTAGLAMAATVDR